MRNKKMEMADAADLALALSNKHIQDKHERLVIGTENNVTRL